MVRLDNETAERLTAWRQERADCAWRQFEVTNPNSISSPAGWKADYLKDNYTPSFAVNELVRIASDRDSSVLALRFEHTPTGSRRSKQVILSDRVYDLAVGLMKRAGLQQQCLGRFIRVLVDVAAGAPLPETAVLAVTPCGAWFPKDETQPTSHPSLSNPLTSYPSSPVQVVGCEPSLATQRAREGGQGRPGKKPCMRAFLGASFFSRRGSDRDENVVFAALLGHANNNGLFAYVGLGKLAEYLLPDENDRIERASAALARLVEAGWLKPARGHNSIYGQVDGWYPQVPAAPTAATPEAA